MVVQNSSELPPVLAWSVAGDVSPSLFRQSFLMDIIHSDAYLTAQFDDVFLSNRYDQIWSSWKNLKEVKKSAQFPESDSGLLLTTWTQHEPYNSFCPLDQDTGRRSNTGCVATALAQVLFYWNLSSVPVFDQDDRYVSEVYAPVRIDQDSEVADFPDFPRLNAVLNDPESDEFIPALNFAAAVSVQTDFSSSGSRASTEDCALALKNIFHYKQAYYQEYGVTDRFFPILQQNIKNAQPCILRIQKVIDDILIGHAVVCDGFRESQDPGAGGYYHLNFGWGEGFWGGNPDPIQSAWYFLPHGMPADYQLLKGMVCYIAPDTPSGSTSLFVSQDGDNQGGLSWEHAYQSIDLALTAAADIAPNQYHSVDIYLAPEEFFPQAILYVPDNVHLIALHQDEPNSGMSYCNLSLGGQFVNLGKISGIHFSQASACAVMNYGELYQCSFYDNQSQQSGAAVVNHYGLIDSCAFYRNSTVGDRAHGGALYDSYGTIQNSLFMHNEAGGRGGAISSAGGTILHCSVFSNKAGTESGGIYNPNGSVKNSISWNNDFQDILCASISGSCFGGASELYGSNLWADPMFEDPLQLNLQLKNGSPCLDAALLNDSIQMPEYDFFGQNRPGLDGKASMGAFEMSSFFAPDRTEPFRYYVSSLGTNQAGSSWEEAWVEPSAAVDNALLLHDSAVIELYLDAESFILEKELFVPGRIHLIGSEDESNVLTELVGNGLNRTVFNCGGMENISITGGAGDYGGGVKNSGFMSSCKVFQNRSTRSGGGVLNYYGTVADSSICWNLASVHGAGILNMGLLDRCRVFSNLAGQNGGGIANNGGIVSNSIVCDNYAERIGGGIYNVSVVENCTVVYNRALDYGSGIISWGDVLNSICWYNLDDNVYLIDDGQIRYSCFPESSGENHNHNLDPVFIKGNGLVEDLDLQLDRTSPCIDGGNPEQYSLFDIDLNRRPYGKFPDMGAYECFFKTSVPLGRWAVYK